MLKKILKILTISLCIMALMTALPFQVMAKPKKLSKNVKVGDIVYFGKYEQDGNTKNGKEKIEWQVLDKKEGKVLLISKKILDVQPYNEVGEDMTWEKCTLRDWLNDDFIKTAFNTKEIERVQKSKIENKDNKESKTEGGKNTKDKVFLLSIDEANKYFKTTEKRTAEITNNVIKILAKLWETKEKYLKEVEGRFGKFKEYSYWLRSPGSTQGDAFIIDENGYEFCSMIFQDDYGVRPAIWVNP